MDNFPSLKDKWFRFETEEDGDEPLPEGVLFKCCGCDPDKFENEDITYKDEVNDKRFYEEETVKKHCLGKAKVEKAWHRFIEWCGSNKHNLGEFGDMIKMDYVNNGFKTFVEELGLK